MTELGLEISTLCGQGRLNITVGTGAADVLEDPNQPRSPLLLSMIQLTDRFRRITKHGYILFYTSMCADHSYALETSLSFWPNIVYGGGANRI